MGSSFSTVILPDGRTEKFDYAASVYATVDNYDIVLGFGQGMGVWSYFRIRDKENDEFLPFGEENYTYGIIEMPTEDGGRFIGSVSDFAVIDDEVYLIAQRIEDGLRLSPGVYKINTVTGVTERVIDETAVRFRTAGDYIYFLCEEGLLYRDKIGENLPEDIRVLSWTRPAMFTKATCGMM